jgi:hypothetical protein
MANPYLVVAAAARLISSLLMYLPGKRRDGPCLVLSLNFLDA